MSERMDDLLEEAMATGTIPEGASAVERTEVERLLGTMGLVIDARSRVGEEGAASMPTARARFQRYVAASEPARGIRTVDAIPRPRMLPWGRLVPRGLTMALAGSAAAIGVLAVAAVVLWRTTLNDPQSAYAQVVEPGDYVQVEGVVEETGEGGISLKSALGDVDVEIQEGTTLVDAQTAQEVSTLRPGDRLLVSGIAGKGRKLVAQTLAVGGEPGQAAPTIITFRQLERLRSDLEGEVITYTISSDGTRGAVLIDAGDGERFLVPVDGPSAARLLARASTALGQRVTVVEESGVTSGTFTLDVPSLPPPEESTTPPAEGQRPDSAGDRSQPTFVSVRGVVTNVQVRPAAADSGRILEGVVTIQTSRRLVQVVVRATTRVFPGESGLTAGAGLRGEAAGHTIFVSGGLEKDTGQVLADVIVMGPMVARPSR